MDIQEIKQLIKIVEKSDIGELELVEQGRKIRISKNSRAAASGAGSNGMVSPVYVQPQVPVHGADAPVPAAPGGPAAAEVPDSDKYYEVRSPMVGTFYRAPAPDADPYVDVGDAVNEGTTLCIIEAMKLMNEIESEVRGKVAKVMVENTQPVEYNQVLFLIER